MTPISITFFFPSSVPAKDDNYPQKLQAPRLELQKMIECTIIADDRIVEHSLLTYFIEYLLEPCCDIRLASCVVTVYFKMLISSKFKLLSIRLELLSSLTT